MLSAPATWLPLLSHLPAAAPIPRLRFAAPADSPLPLGLDLNSNLHHMVSMALFLPQITQDHQLPVSSSSPAILCVVPPRASPAPQALSIQGSWRFLA